MKILISLFVLLFLCSSCGGIKVSYDYDERAEFSRFKTYNYINEESAGISPLDLKRIKEATDSILQSLNYQKTEDPELLLDIFGDEYEEAPASSIGIGVGGGSGNVGMGVGGGIPIGGRKLHQTITFNMVDAQKNDLIWQAVSDSNLKIQTDPAQRMTYFKKLVERIFQKFPPEN